MASMYDKVWKWSDAKKRRQLAAVRPRMGAVSYDAMNVACCTGRTTTTLVRAAPLAHAA